MLNQVVSKTLTRPVRPRAGGAGCRLRGPWPDSARMGRLYVPLSARKLRLTGVLAHFKQISGPVLGAAGRWLGERPAAAPLAGFRPSWAGIDDTERECVG